MELLATTAMDSNGQVEYNLYLVLMNVSSVRYIPNDHDLVQVTMIVPDESYLIPRQDWVDYVTRRVTINVSLTPSQVKAERLKLMNELGRRGLL